MARTTSSWNRLRRAVVETRSKFLVQKRNCVYVAADSRMLLERLPKDSIDCVITSPPYGQLKDYGSKGQIGYGQESDEHYLEDISRVLLNLYKVCREGAALWVVLDTVKSSGKTLVLPWEVIQKATVAGWHFEDLVVWDKGRSLPWSHAGHLRGVFEYVLLLSKNKLRRFTMDKVRDIDHLSSYWVKYPERYNPAGKAPTDIWHFPIPVQGSWSRNGIRHFCPFPMPMVARMLALTTDVGDVVLDPFAGTGSVLTAASFLGRRSLGIDINRRFVQRFATSGYTTLNKVAAGEIRKPSDRGTSGLYSLLVRLRMLKYPKTLFVQLSRPDRLGNGAYESVEAFVMSGATLLSGSDARRMGRLRLMLLVREGAEIASIRETIKEVVGLPPLSKFGLEVEVQVIPYKRWTASAFLRGLPKTRAYRYTRGEFNCYQDVVKRSDLIGQVRTKTDRGRSKIPPVYSWLKVDTKTIPEV